jgi:hypothetical protein
MSAVAINLARMLFNGVPGLLAMAIDRLGLKRAMARCTLAPQRGTTPRSWHRASGSRAASWHSKSMRTWLHAPLTNRASMPWVEVRQSDGTDALNERFDALLMNAGVTHPHDAWLDAIASGRRNGDTHSSSHSRPLTGEKR